MKDDELFYGEIVGVDDSCYLLRIGYSIVIQFKQKVPEGSPWHHPSHLVCFQRVN
jgi:hypothetical protein